MNGHLSDNQTTHDLDGGSDSDDSVTQETWQQDIYSSDPIDAAVHEPPVHPSRFQLSNLFSSPFYPKSHTRILSSPPTVSSSPPRRNTLRRRTTPTQSANLSAGGFDELDGNSNSNLAPSTFPLGAKETPSTKDWHIEGPGRRVGYDDLTAIDWIFEYAKERQRHRILLSGATGVLGQVRRFIDASQIWWILILSGVATGVVAASIDIASDWLGDLKSGICRTGARGGKFYLNKSFCCWGLDETAQCPDWTSWSTLFGSSSAGGGYILEYGVFISFSVIFAVSASFLVKHYASHAKQSGIPEIKTVLGGFVMKSFLGGWTLTVKSVGLCLAVSSGLWLGKEGPLVHVACCCAYLFLRMFPNLNNNEARKREVLSAAAAAGISVAFGAPVGGVLFSLEQLSFYFPDKTMWQSFVCAMIAAVTLQAFNPFRTGKLVLYQVTYLTQWHAFEILPFAFLGILGGLYGGLFIKLNMLIARFRKNYNPLRNPIFEVAVVSLASAVINFPNKFMRAQTTELVATLFSECSELKDEQLGLCGISPTPVVVSSLLAAAALGFLLTSFTFGLMVPAGIILPSMAIGALLGRTVGLIMRTWQEEYPNLLIFSACEPDVRCVTAGTYAIVGAAAALAGATRMTVSIVVIMFELTGALTYVLPIMISVMISKWVGDVFGKQGIYEAWIQLNGYPFLDNRDEVAVPDVAVAQIMTRIEDMVVIPGTGFTIQTLDHLLRAHPFRGFAVVTDTSDQSLLGYISRTELIYALKNATGPPRNLSLNTKAFFCHQPSPNTDTTLDLRPWMDQTPITLSSKSSLQLAADMFLKLGLRYVLFVDQGKLKGLLTKKDVWYALSGVEGKKAVSERTIVRDEIDGEHRGLLRSDGGIEDESSDGRRYR